MEELHNLLIGEQLFQGRQIVEREWVDGDAFLFRSHLNEAQLGPIGLLAKEFGVDGEQFAYASPVDELLQLPASGYVQRFSFSQSFCQ